MIKAEFRARGARPSCARSSPLSSSKFSGARYPPLLFRTLLNKRCSTQETLKVSPVRFRTGSKLCYVQASAAFLQHDVLVHVLVSCVP